MARELREDEEALRSYDAEPEILRISSEDAAGRGGREPQARLRARHEYPDGPGR